MLVLLILTSAGSVVSLHVHVNVVFAVNVTFALGLYVQLNFGVVYPLAVIHSIVVNCLVQLWVGAVPFHVISVLHEFDVVHTLDTHTHFLYVAVYVH